MTTTTVPAWWVIQRPGSALLSFPEQPTAGRWYVGVYPTGQTGALAQWDGFAFQNSESDDVKMTGYAYLREQPPRG